MTPTATYIAEENCLQEESQMEAPLLSPIEFTEGTDEYNACFAQWQAYLNHCNSLRRIPCDPSCKGLWADGQKLVEGVDYRVKEITLPADHWQDVPTKRFRVFPLVPAGEDELWREAISVIKDCVKRESWDTIMAELKSKYSLTKR